MSALLIVQPPTQYVGTSTDTKPSYDVAPGSQFFALDTGIVFLYDGAGIWYPQGNVTAAAVLAQLESNEVLADTRLELMAVRLAVQETYNEGRSEQTDFRELAQTMVDRSETEEP